jgi:hypothetical protein
MLLRSAYTDHILKFVHIKLLHLLHSFSKGLSLILEAKEEDAVKRTRLEQLLSQTAVCLHGMQEKVFNVINEDFPNVLGTFKERIERLQQRDYYILVAGE